MPIRKSDFAAERISLQRYLISFSYILWYIQTKSLFSQRTRASTHDTEYHQFYLDSSKAPNPAIIRANVAEFGSGKCAAHPSMLPVKRELLLLIELALAFISSTSQLLHNIRPLANSASALAAQRMKLAARSTISTS